MTRRRTESTIQHYRHQHQRSPEIISSREVKNHSFSEKKNVKNHIISTQYRSHSSPSQSPCASSSAVIPPPSHRSIQHPPPRPLFVATSLSPRSSAKPLAFRDAEEILPCPSLIHRTWMPLHRHAPPLTDAPPVVALCPSRSPVFHGFPLTYLIQQVRGGGFFGVAVTSLVSCVCESLGWGGVVRRDDF